jgi:hypothetical protein
MALSSELQHAAAWGVRPQPQQIKILRWFPSKNASGTVLGFISAELPSGMIVHSMRLMRGPAGKLWIGMPDTSDDDSLILNDAGKPMYDKIIEFANGRAREKFGEAILAALQRSHPEAIKSESAR